VDEVVDASARPRSTEGRATQPALIPTNSRRWGRRRQRQQRRQRCFPRYFQGHFTWPYACLSPSRARGTKRRPNALHEPATCPAGFDAGSTQCTRHEEPGERQAAAGAKSFEAIEGNCCLGSASVATKPTPARSRRAQLR